MSSEDTELGFAPRQKCEAVLGVSAAQEINVPLSHAVLAPHAAQFSVQHWVCHLATPGPTYPCHSFGSGSTRNVSPTPHANWGCSAQMPSQGRGSSLQVMILSKPQPVALVPSASNSWAVHNLAPSSAQWDCAVVKLTTLLIPLPAGQTLSAQMAQPPFCW